MAIPWITVLQLVPWTDVIRNAPAVLDSARKLWETARKKPPGRTAPAVAAPAGLPTPEARIAALEATVAALGEQVVESSALIKELAEQNANLIRRAEQNRVMAVRLGYALTVVGAVAVAAVVIALRA